MLLEVKKSVFYFQYLENIEFWLQIVPQMYMSFQLIVMDSVANLFYNWFLID